MKNLLICASLLALLESSAHAVTFDNQTGDSVKVNIKVGTTKRLRPPPLPAGKSDVDLKDKFKDSISAKYSGHFTVQITTHGKEICNLDKRIPKLDPASTITPDTIAENLNALVIDIKQDTCAIEPTTAAAFK